MFSYRHAFHAGNHADVFKHLVLTAVLRHLVQKETPLLLVDTHAGAGLYRLDGEYALTSAEASGGILRLLRSAGAAPALQDYLDLVAGFNPQGGLRVYPGSPFIMARFLRPRDRLKLLEWHPSDAQALAANVAQLGAGRQVAVVRADGFTALKGLLPPPSRRALVLCDPSYEVKSDYSRVVAVLCDALERFATGVYAVWYPIIPRLEAHALPHKLKALAAKWGKSWLQASLTVKSSKLVTDETGALIRPGLPASGMLILNPPHTLKDALALALPQLVAQLAQDKHAGFGLESDA